MGKLTKRTVEAAKPPKNGKGWSWVGDTEVPGFGVRIYPPSGKHPNGRRTYALRYRTASGRQRMMTLGQHGELTVKTARKRAMEKKVQVLDGADPLAEKKRREAAIRTVKDLMDRWIEDYAKKHRKRWQEDKRRVEARILPPLGRVPVVDVDSARLRRWHTKIGKESPVEANRCLETVRAAWRWAETGRLLPDGAESSDMFRGGKNAPVKRFRERSRDRWLRRAELDRLMTEVRKEGDPYIRAAIPLLLLTGLRKMELLRARWEDVDLERAEIRLPETKSGEAQVRLLPPPAVEILRGLPRERSPWVFPSPVDRTKHRRDFKRPWERVRKAADLEDITLHDLRRTAGSYMAQAGVPLEVIQKVLGQSHPAVTRIYARLASENERDAVETLARELSDVLGGSPSPDGEAPHRGSGKDLRNQLEALLHAGVDGSAIADRLRAMATELEE